MRSTCLAVAVALIAGAGVSADQQKPDFSGTWVVVTPADAAGQSETIKQDEKTLTTSHGAEHGSHHSMTYRLDGTEARNVLTSHGEEIVTLSKASWTGNRLVITETTSYPDGRKGESRAVWSLDADGRLIKEGTQTLNGKATTWKSVSKRKSQQP